MKSILRRAGRACACAVMLYGCADAQGSGPAVTRETVGDTAVVRVGGAIEERTPQQELIIGELDGAEELTFGQIDGLAVSEDGSIYVLDGQAQTIRIFDATGRYVSTFGRAGEGPGELKQPGGMVFLPDGRLAVRDPGNARISIYSATGESLTTWPIPGGFFTSAPMFVDTAGRLYTDVIAERRPDGSWNVGLLRLDSTGAVVDTLARPFRDYEAPTLRAERRSAQGTSLSMSNVPFWPQPFSAINRRGEVVGGIADRYAILTWRADGSVQRIERERAPVAVEQGEADAAVERITRSMSNLQSGWRWDGPRPPAHKPHFSELRIADDDRIWVRVPQTSVRQDPDPDAEPDDKGRMPVDTWLEPMVYEVFEPTGEPVATVRMPERFRPWVMRGNHIWGVLRDDMDVQYIVRLRI
jgi:hypothetical protein